MSPTIPTPGARATAAGHISSLLPRSHYPTLEDAVYLNQAAIGLIGKPAVDAMRSFLDDVARHGNRLMSDRQEEGYSQALRSRAASLLNVETSGVAITASASELLGQLPFLLDPGGRGTVVVVDTDFPALTRPWLRWAEHTEGELLFVTDTPTENLTDTIVSALSERTSVLATSQVQYATGSRVDVPRLREATRQVGAQLIVDASQAAGAVPVDATAWDAEVVVSSGYKWLGGHGGVALAAVSERLFEDVPPLPGWLGAHRPFDFDATRLEVADDARRFTQATMSYVSMAGLTVALDCILEAGIERIEAHARALGDLLFDGLAGAGWQSFRNRDDSSASPHIVSLAHAELAAGQAAAALGAQNILCGTRGGRVRVSLASYNDESDVRALLGAMHSLV